MVQTAITQTIKTINEAHAKFNLQQTAEEEFFTEWFESLPQLTQQEQTALDQIRYRYRYHRADGPLAEGAVNLIVVSRLLELAGFYDSPFKLQAEVAVEVTTVVEDEILRGRIDFLVVLEQFWVVVLEAKHTDLNIELAIPQTLAYMMASPHPDRPVYGMVTNGGMFAFLKLSQQPTPQYDISDVFSLLPSRNQLYPVLQILKQVGQSISQG
ncbi:MAG TPA: type I restriction endonuclease subunit R [Cyanobacteria bacterium UBA8803]|nr:type I restriction endonuclease subunit R [Cyanobacteria bacterium UBA9273]HBL61859.1 type I restriction endonuclease subunit R [Cyanobacteria bacterium UBA8803]